jgi:hypothetical protein
MKEEIEIIAVIHLPLPVSGFIGLIQGIQKDFEDDPLYIRNCPVGYEVFRIIKKAAVRT